MIKALGETQTLLAIVRRSNRALLTMALINAADVSMRAFELQADSITWAPTGKGKGGHLTPPLEDCNILL